jgi:hypothetical protein
MTTHAFTGEILQLTELDHPVLRDAYAYWSRKKADRVFPSRKDICPGDMRRYLPRVMLVDVAYEPINFVYRVFGSGVAQAYGREFTGKSVRELEPADFAGLIWDQYLDAVKRREPCLHAVSFASQGKYLKYQRLTLPLSSDGSVIDKLLAVSIEDGKFWKSVGDAKAGSATLSAT